MHDSERSGTVAHPDSQDQIIDRELKRERHERELLDDERTGLGLGDELRTKDAREHLGAVNLRRQPGNP